MSTFFQNNLIETLPSISEIKFSKLHKKYFKVLFINILLIFLSLFGVFFLLAKFQLNEKIPTYIPYIYFSLGIVFFLVMLYYIFSFSKRQYAIRERDITYKSGLFFKKITTVPFSRVQHVEVDEGPISRMYQLASLSVYTAGDSSDDLVIKGITQKKAMEIKEFIHGKINE